MRDVRPTINFDQIAELIPLFDRGTTNSSISEDSGYQDKIVWEHRDPLADILFEREVAKESQDGNEEHCLVYWKISGHFCKVDESIG